MSKKTYEGPSVDMIVMFKVDMLGESNPLTTYFNYGDDGWL